MISRRTFISATLALVAVSQLPRLRPAIAGDSSVLFLLLSDSQGWERSEAWMDQGLLPGLAYLRDNYSYLRVDPISRSSTVPNWSVWQTGQTPDLTRVETNAIWEPLAPEDSLYDRLRQHGVKVCHYVSKPYLGINYKTNPWAPAARLADDYLLASPQAKGDGYLDILSDKAFAALDQARSSGEPTLVVLHLDPDAYGHWEGAESDRYRQECMRVDGVLQRVLADSGQAVMKLSDHGFNRASEADPNPKHHNCAPFNLMATNLPILPRWLQGGATMRDVPLTILMWFGIPVDPVDSWMWGKVLI